MGSHSVAEHSVAEHSVAEHSTVAPPAVVRPQESGQDRPRWRYRKPGRTLPGGLGAWAALLVVWVIWGSTYIAIRIGDQSIPPLAMASTST